MTQSCFLTPYIEAMEIVGTAAGYQEGVKRQEETEVGIGGGESRREEK